MYRFYATVCVKPYYTVAGPYNSKVECENSGSRGVKQNGCQQLMGQWFPVCDSNYDLQSLNPGSGKILPLICRQNCPQGWKNACNATHPIACIRQ